MIEIVVIVLALGGGWLYATRRPDSARRWYRWIKTGRRVILGSAALAFAFFFVASGVASLMFIGGFFLFYAALLLKFEEPQKKVLSWIT